MNAPDIEIRAARPDDLEAIRALLSAEPVQQLRQAHGQRVDVPGGEFHGGS